MPPEEGERPGDHGWLIGEGEELRGGFSALEKNPGWRQVPWFGVGEYAPSRAAAPPRQACIPGLLTKPGMNRIILELFRSYSDILHRNRFLIYNLRAPAQIRNLPPIGVREFEPSAHPWFAHGLSQLG
jgi:hypothetical protein